MVSWLGATWRKRCQLFCGFNFWVQLDLGGAQSNYGCASTRLQDARSHPPTHAQPNLNTYLGHANWVTASKITPPPPALTLWRCSPCAQMWRGWPGWCPRLAPTVASRAARSTAAAPAGTPPRCPWTAAHPARLGHVCVCIAAQNKLWCETPTINCVLFREISHKKNHNQWWNNKCALNNNQSQLTTFGCWWSSRAFK